VTVSPASNAPPTFDPALPRRTLGLMLALFSVALLLGLLPIFPALLLILIDLGGHPIAPDDASFWLPAIFGLLTLIASIAAWIGRPAATRQALLTIATLTLGVDLVVNSHSTLMTNVGRLFGSTLDGGIRSLSLCLLGFQIAAYVFALWYLNRAPARAFYRRPPR